MSQTNKTCHHSRWLTGRVFSNYGVVGGEVAQCLLPMRVGLLVQGCYCEMKPGSKT